MVVIRNCKPKDRQLNGRNCKPKDRQLNGRNCKPKKDRQLNGNQRLSRACIVQPVIKKSNVFFMLIVIPR
jgi:hypothetical protein